jgi:hypothetical protein
MVPSCVSIRATTNMITLGVKKTRDSDSVAVAGPELVDAIREPAAAMNLNCGSGSYRFPRAALGRGWRLGSPER